jgi:hypothetical protein
MILLLIVPMLIVVGAALPSAKGRFYLLTALLCVVLGTGALFFSFPTSSMAGAPDNGRAVQLAPEVLDLIWKTRVIFSGLLLLYVAIVAIPCILHQQDSRLFTTILPLSFLVLYFAGTIALLSTAEAVALSKPGQVTIPTSKSTHSLDRVQRTNVIVLTIKALPTGVH